MPRIKPHIYLLVLLLLTCGSGHAREVLQYNLNNTNGLPSDHVYCMLRDRNGYLWIGTDKGVVRYNGYSFKSYDISNGLSDPDVWNFFEDKKGRIWLARISNELGYIYNDTYHKVYRKNKADELLYPSFIREYEGGIMFLSMNPHIRYLGVERNDTLSVEKLLVYERNCSLFISLNGEILYWKGGVLYDVQHKGRKVTFSKKCLFSHYTDCQLLNNFIVPAAGIVTDTFFTLNTETFEERQFPLHKDDLIYNHYELDDKNYIIGNRDAYILDSEMKTCREMPFNNYLSAEQLNNNRVVYVTEGALWGNCVATTKAGMYICYEVPYFKKIIPQNLAKFRHVGNGADGLQYWWNKENKTLAVLDGNNMLRYKQYDDVNDIESIQEHEGNNMLMFTPKKTCLLDRYTMNISPLYKNIRHYISNYHTDKPLSDTIYIPPGQALDMPGAQNGLYGADGIFHTVVRGNGYVCYAQQGDTLISNFVSIKRYKDLFYDPVHRAYIIYGDNRILVRTNDTLLQIGEATLKAMGITLIEKIMGDTRYGNIFIKDHDKLLLYNIYKHKFTQLFKNYKLEHAQVYVDDSLLVIAGKFGLLFSKINGPAQLSKHAFYPNTKQIVYKNLYDITSTGANVLLNTDAGLFSAPLPPEHMYRYRIAATDVAYRLVLKYKNTVRNITEGDTILLDQKKRDMQFDVVNPRGVGKLKFRACINEVNNGWNDLNVDELHLPHMKAGKYYPLSLMAYDDNWKSRDMNFVLYFVPGFWQTPMGLGLLWLGIGGLLSGTVFFIIYYTRRVVSRAHLKKNYLLSLELKAIYAQINPHFIFNTLNTGLYYIRENKNAEAYAHISSFSELLRSYIKSSRNKYIPLGEEIENLEYYILLQQSRFDNKFSHMIEIGSEVDTTTTLIPALLLQPFVENAINHGLMNKEGYGHLNLRFFSDKQENEITCIIEDDGVGRAKAAEINRGNPTKPRSYGSELIKDLVNIINTDNEIKISIDYIDKQEPDTGTSVVITIKKLHHDE